MLSFGIYLRRQAVGGAIGGADTFPPHCQRTSSDSAGYTCVLHSAPIQPATNLVCQLRDTPAK